jgi:hypothetical protein
MICANGKVKNTAWILISSSHLYWKWKFLTYTLNNELLPSHPEASGMSQGGNTAWMPRHKILGSVRAANSPNCGYSQRIPSSSHTYGNASTAMAEKENTSSSLEKYYVFITSNINLHIIDTNIDCNSPVPGTMSRLCNRRAAPTHPPPPPAEPPNIQATITL